MQPAITVYRKQIYLTRQYIFASNVFTHITIVVSLLTKYSLSVPVLQLDLIKWALVPSHTNSTMNKILKNRILKNQDKTSLK